MTVRETEFEQGVSTTHPLQSVSVSNLRKTFGSVTAIENISTEFESGKRSVLLGPSGCGKTTLLRCIGGLERPDAGSVFVGSRAIVSATNNVYVPAHKRRIGMVFQSYALWPHMTVADNVGYPLRVRGIASAEVSSRVDEALHLVQLGDMGSRYPAQLSGGQQQRVAFARAIIFHPDVLLLDEPLSNLDAKLREEMRFEIVALQQKLGITMIHVTHDQGEAMALADHLVVMRAGIIVQAGPPEDVYMRPASPFVADFMDAGNLLEGEIAGITPNATEVVTSGGMRIGTEALQIADGGLQVGSPVVVCLRQDSIAVRPTEVSVSPDDSNRWTGRVVAASFAGDARIYRIEVLGESLRAKAPRTVGAVDTDVKVEVSIAPQDVHLFPLRGSHDASS